MHLLYARGGDFKEANSSFMTRNEIIEIAGNFVKLGVKNTTYRRQELVRHDAKELWKGSKNGR